MVVLLYSNQQVSQTVGGSSTTIKILVENLEAFIEQSKDEAISVTTGAADDAISNINQDLDSKFRIRFICSERPP